MNTKSHTNSSIVLTEVACDKGKQKKWKKKMDKGEINTTAHYALMSVLWGLKVTDFRSC
jgi:hypothetical protein